MSAARRFGLRCLGGIRMAVTRADAEYANLILGFVASAMVALGVAAIVGAFTWGHFRSRAADEWRECIERFPPADCARALKR